MQPDLLLIPAATLLRVGRVPRWARRSADVQATAIAPHGFRFPTRPSLLCERRRASRDSAPPTTRRAGLTRPQSGRVKMAPCAPAPAMQADVLREHACLLCALLPTIPAVPR